MEKFVGFFHIPRTTREKSADFPSPRKLLHNFLWKSVVLTAPRLKWRVQGMENARFIPRPKGRSFRAFFINLINPNFAIYSWYSAGFKRKALRKHYSLLTLSASC